MSQFLRGFRLKSCQMIVQIGQAGQIQGKEHQNPGHSLMPMNNVSFPKKTQLYKTRGDQERKTEMPLKGREKENQDKNKGITNLEKSGEEQAQPGR